MNHRNDMEEALNRRSLWLRLYRYLWILPACTVAGALLAVLIYSGIWLGLSGQRQYRQSSKFYLTFGTDAAGNVQDYYNDYTWNDLLFSVPAISQVIESELPEGMTMEAARQDVEAQILSDVRLLTIQVTDPDPDRVQALTNAVQDALVRYGHNSEEFERIEFLSSDEVERVVVSDRSRNAALLGAFLGFLISAAALWLWELLDEGVYCPEDAARRYGLPVLLVLPGEELPSFLEEENQQEAAGLRQKYPDGIRLISEDAELAEETGKTLLKRYQIPVNAAGSTDVKNPEVVTAGKEAGERVFAVIPFGKRNAGGTDHLLTQKNAKGETVTGLILAEADGKFLKKYYGRK